MTAYMLTYFILFSITYYLGHFCMSMAYGLGPAATTVMAAVLFAAVIVTLWKASGCAEGKKEALWGIFAGFFLWCFFGEFLEHERILSLVEPDARLLLLACVLLIGYLMYRKPVSVGMRFALGHFGCVWLLHAVLANQTAMAENHDPALYAVSTPAMALAFLVIALLMLLKTIRARSDNARLAFLLPAFIFFWAGMETLQAMDCLPDYICYAYWTGGTASERKTCTLEETVDTKISQMENRYAWKDQQAEKRAYAFVKKLPSPHLIDDFAERLERQFARAGGKQMDEELFYRVVEESFVDSAASAFKHLLTACVQQFKAASLSGRIPGLEYADSAGGGSSREDMEAKAVFIRERYNWDTTQTRDLAVYLMKRFAIQFLAGDAFIQNLDALVEGKQTDTIGEETFCRAMLNHFAAVCRIVFRSLMEQHLRTSG